MRPTRRVSLAVTSLPRGSRDAPPPRLALGHHYGVEAPAGAGESAEARREKQAARSEHGAVAGADAKLTVGVVTEGEDRAVGHDDGGVMGPGGDRGGKRVRQLDREGGGAATHVLLLSSSYPQLSVRVAAEADEAEGGGEEERRLHLPRLFTWSLAHEPQPQLPLLVPSPREDSLLSLAATAHYMLEPARHRQQSDPAQPRDAREVEHAPLLLLLPEPQPPPHVRPA
eukprot:222535-Hanusia_phi.AAC.4